MLVYTNQFYFHKVNSYTIWNLYTGLISSRTVKSVKLRISILPSQTSPSVIFVQSFRIVLFEILFVLDDIRRYREFRYEEIEHLSF